MYSERDGRESAKSGTGRMGKEVLRSELEADKRGGTGGKSGTDDGSRYSELQTLNVMLRLMHETKLTPISPVPLFPLVAHRSVSRFTRHDLWPSGAV
jgi:hypothetical protein